MPTYLHSNLTFTPVKSFLRKPPFWSRLAAAIFKKIENREWPTAQPRNALKTVAYFFTGFLLDPKTNWFIQYI